MEIQERIESPMQLHSERSANVVGDAAQNDTPMEWWFVQGFYEGDQSGRREFMATLFRYQFKLPSATLAGPDAFALLLTVLDPATGRTTVLSQVDPLTCKFLVTAGRLGLPAGFDPIVNRTVADEVAEYGPPRPIHTEPTPVQWTTSPFRVAWNGFVLEQGPDAFALCFTEPESGRRCRLRLTPLHPRIHLANVAVVGNETMDDLSYTRLALEGGVDGEPVRGQAWLDHQWGSQGWFAAGSEKERILGWDWLGIQLDNGHDLLVMVHRDQQQGHRLCQYAVLVNETGPARLIRDFVLTPTSWWTSPATHTRYPVAWHLTMPELDLELDFEPYTNEQEIPMLAPLRAVWEGAGRVTGTWSGQAITGRARLELHGYAYVFNLRGHLEDRMRRIRQHLEDYFPRVISDAVMERFAGPAHGQYDSAAQTAMLATPLWDMLDRGGKNWRPIFAFLLLDALGVSPEPFELLFSFTSEILHEGALVIDDIQDNARIRRGAECVHLRYGLDVAISAANTAYFLPMVLLRDYPHLSDAQRLELYRILSRVYVRAHLGQGQDIYWSKFLTVDRLCEGMKDSLASKIIQLYTQKTAAVVEGAAEVACVIARSNTATRQACADFGRVFGVAFQIVNDILDFSPGRVAGGHGGCDLSEGKLSYALFQSLKHLPRPERLRLGTILCFPDLRNQPSTLAEGIELVQKSGGLKACRKEVHTMMEEQWERLSVHLPPSESKTMLRVLCQFILSLGDDERNIEFAPGN